MKQVVYVDHVPVLSGAELALCALLARLDRSRWQPRVILAAAGPLEERLRKAGIPVEVLPMPQSLLGRRPLKRAAFLNPLRDASGIAYVARLAGLLRGQADLVHANSLRSCILAGAAAGLAGLPNVWQIHSVVAPPMIPPQAARILRFLAGHMPRQVIFNSQAAASCFDLPANKVNVVPPGVDGDLFQPSDHPARQVTRIGMVARLAPLKGQHIFVEAAQRLARTHPRMEFLIAGTPLFGEEEYARRVQAQAAAGPHGNRIRFLGFVEDVPALMRDLDVVVHASTLPDAFGQVIVEAMLSGRPVVATAIGGAAEMIEDGVTGRLVPPADAAALAAAIAELVGDKQMAAAITRRARALALDRFDVRSTAHAIEAVYEKALAA
jgi:glycosyltransferase involved in cell wall biosynthesis